MQLRSQVRAFTLIELLVVNAIIAILIGLLLPAVQKVRVEQNEAGAATVLQQLALAIHNYEESNGVLPRSLDDLEFDEERFGHRFLLPYIEQSNVITLEDLGRRGILAAAQPAAPGLSGIENHTIDVAGKIRSQPDRQAAQIAQRVISDLQSDGNDLIAQNIEDSGLGNQIGPKDTRSLLTNALIVKASLDVLDGDGNGTITLAELCEFGERGPRQRHASLQNFPIQSVRTMVEMVCNALEFGAGEEDLNIGVRIADIAK